MIRKKAKIPDQKARVYARFGKKRQETRAFCLTHFNIQVRNRHSSAKNGDSQVEKARFRGVREIAFS